MTSSPSQFLANLRARHIVNVAERLTFDDKIEALQREYESKLADLQIARSAADAAFQTSAGILDDAETAFGDGPSADDPFFKRADGSAVLTTGGPPGKSAAEPATRAKRGEIGALILSTLREVPIAGMTEDEIIGALPQHKPGSISAAIKSMIKKDELTQANGRFFSAADAAHDRVVDKPAAEPAAQPNGSHAPEPIAQPASGPISPAIGEPNPVSSQHIINAIKAGPKTYDELMDRCIALGGDADGAKATLLDLVDRKVVEPIAEGRYDFVGPQ